MSEKVNKLDPEQIISVLGALKGHESNKADEAEDDEVAVTEIVLRANEEFGFDEVDHAMLLAKVLAGIESRFGDNDMHLSAEEMDKGLARYESGPALEYLQKVRKLIFG